MKKRSVVIAGHRTSVSLEDPFWAELKAMAAARDMPLAALIEEIDAGRETDNLSSALRIAILECLRRRLAEGG
ncbi:ribbon-helix-helix domain-containing protein [Afifella marina]|uniref:Ribbon-helix-helix domain-containing protein n=1 Tax=Afifella marina DSM 2698 TaxID=1120955 RepID=A0A1G5N5U6_AFIMA|nr:ribbon-helix-helix domain-containing protein [Afifella marina]MBK1622434.1 aryl-sulfate sulfotransferase [Afifella marina DSM 2698]MBK1626852.1 aryl-sulfate sulfotransferase [Afifella marina]MBK5919218.1 aryl-sulfate sulfotransferase [Afifella marina]RAI21261.1 aryl-sulfate sulfotransferase [Afifella marina DSM 2698]SCZ32099.1 Ribbon-helix-helix domain-containing protein [Afifella marina DSM 2698]